MCGRVAGGEKEDPVLAPEEASQPADKSPPPASVSIERSPNFDRLVQNWTRIGEEWKGVEMVVSLTLKLSVN